MNISFRKSLVIGCVIFMSSCTQSPAMVENKAINKSQEAVSRPKFYVVKSKDTAYSIAKNNGISVADLAQANNLKEPYIIRPGTKLMIKSSNHPTKFAAKNKNDIIPLTAARAPESLTVTSSDLGTLDAKPSAKTEKKEALILSESEQDELLFGDDSSDYIAQKAETKITTPTAQDKDEFEKMIIAATNIGEVKNEKPVQPVMRPAAAKETKTLTAKTETSGFLWPAKGKIVSRFGPKDGGLYNDGINIAAKEGTTIKSADSGKVVYSGNELRGYGNLVLIKHENGFVTAYAHAKKLLVKKGDAVKKGQTIAYVGDTGHVSQPQLHFSIRKGRKAIDPEKYLPHGTKV